MICFIDVRQQARENPDAVQDFVRNGLVRIGIAAARLQGIQTGYAGVYESLKILLGRNLRAGWWSLGRVEGQIADIRRAPEGKDIVGGLGEFVELRPPLAVGGYVVLSSEPKDILFERQLALRRTHAGIASPGID